MTENTPKGIFSINETVIVDFGAYSISKGEKTESLIESQPILLYALIRKYMDTMPLTKNEALQVTDCESKFDVTTASYQTIQDSYEALRQKVNRLKHKLSRFGFTIEAVRGVGYSLSQVNSIKQLSESSTETKATQNDFYSVVRSDDYLSFIKRVIRKYYGDAFLTQINERWFMVYTIPGTGIANNNIKGLDDLICPKEYLNKNLGEDELFHAESRNEYENTEYYKDYYNFVFTNIHFPKRPGYMLDTIFLDEKGYFDHISAHVATYAENVFTCHAVEYELYRAFLKYKDRNIDDPEIWKKLYSGLKMRNSYYNAAGRPDDDGYDEKMKSLLLSGNKRHALIGLEMMILIKDPLSNNYRVIIGERSEQNAMAQRVYEYPPAGGFEVFNNSDDEIYTSEELTSNYSPGYGIFREYLEELFNLSEYDGTGNGDAFNRIFRHPVICKIQQLMDLGKAEFRFLGVSVDLLLLRANLNFVLVIDDVEYPSGGFVVNNEYRKGRLLDDVFLTNMEEREDIWKRHHGPSAGIWYLFKQTELYKDLLNKIKK